MKLNRFVVLALVASISVLALASCGKSTSVTSVVPGTDLAPPAAPTTLHSAYADGVGYDYLYWNPSTSATVSGYEVWESATQGGTAVKIASVGATSNYVVLPAVDSDCTRFYQVRAQNAVGYSAFSSAVAVDRHVVVVTAGGGSTPGTGIGQRIAD